MPAYHSSYNDELEHRQIGNMAILPFSSKLRGSAPFPADPERDDIITEALDLFRANSLFRNFEIKGGADRMLIYLILFIGDCLTKIAQSAKAPGWTPQEAQKQLSTYAIENFHLPGEPAFPMNSLYQAPANRLEADALRQYLTHARSETVARLLEKVYDPEFQGKPSKWWMSFQKRKFMGKTLGATGSLSRGQDEGAVYPNDEQGWRTSWMFPAKITSLKACGDRLLATCFGPPAQALVGTTSDSISLASVTLKPQKTSLWSSALSPSIVALGCDRKVLISRDPTRHSMDGITTGGRHGDGAVFGLDLTENLIFAGTRGGKVKVFDLRASGSATEREQAQRPEVHLSLPTSVTSVHRIQDGLLVSGIDGIRIFSLRTGTLVTSSHASSIQNREFEDSIKALCWGPEGVGMNIPRRDDGYEGEEVRRKWEDMGIGGGKGPSLWIGDGEVVKGFSVEGLE
ncbi:putative Arp2/3 complex subunit Arc18 [Pseudohyphozyma bogoriensis]|nr:putative Arp2/3 complex subunit Arc18 [Pseudohyphozyma bogoriensis]